MSASISMFFNDSVQIRKASCNDPPDKPSIDFRGGGDEFTVFEVPLHGLLRLRDELDAIIATVEDRPNVDEPVNEPPAVETVEVNALPEPPF